MTVFCQHKKQKAPGLEKFQNCESNEDRAALTGVAKATHAGSIIFRLAPWLVQALNDACTTNPLSLIPIILEAAELYDDEHKRCDEDYQRARDHAEAAANFLWLISTGKITPLKFAVLPDDEELQKYCSNRIKKCLKVPMVSVDVASTSNDSVLSSDQKDVLKQLNSNLASQIESIQESNRLSKLEYDRKVENMPTRKIA